MKESRFSEIDFRILDSWILNSLSVLDSRLSPAAGTLLTPDS